MSDLDRYFEPRRRGSRLGVIALGAVFIVLAMLGTYGCREKRIDDCRARGGTPIVPAWFTDEPHDVRCLEAGRG